MANVGSSMACLAACERLDKRVADLEAMVHKLAKNDTTVAEILDMHRQMHGNVSTALQALNEQINQVKGLL